jgi:hypothetical protein
MSTTYHNDVAIVGDPNGGSGQSARFDVQSTKWNGPTKIDGSTNSGTRHDVERCVWIERTADLDLELEFPTGSSNLSANYTWHRGSGSLPFYSTNVATFRCESGHEGYDFTLTCSYTLAADPEVLQTVSITVRVRSGTGSVPGSP